MNAPAMKCATDDEVLRVLAELHEQHRENLRGGGFDPAAAKVRLVDWRASTGLDLGTFASIVRRLIESGRIVHLDLYVWPADGGPR